MVLEENREGKDDCYMENSLLSEIEGNRGTKRFFNVVGGKRLEFHWILLLVYYLFIYLVHYLLLGGEILI